MKTMICLILDRSGSMSGREGDVIGGVNTFLDEQKKLPDPASIAFVRFDDAAIERFRPMQTLAECKELTAEDYQPRGGTPLLDAIGRTVSQLDEDWKAETPDRCILVIVTDGQENASKEYTKDKIKAMIQARQDSGKWAFIYLGANVDAFAEAGSMGINLSNSAGYQNTAKGTASLYSTASAGVSMMRATGKTVAHNLGGEIEEDGTLTKRKTPDLVQSSAKTTWTPPTTGKSDSTVWTPPA
jgi:uncharacterized protein YegL